MISSDASRRSINIYSSLNAPVVAVNDGVIKKMGDNAKLGKYIVLQDAYGNDYTYAHLGSIAQTHPVPRQQSLSAKTFKLETPNDSSPDQPGHRRRQLRPGLGEGRQVGDRQERTGQLRELPPAPLRSAAPHRQRGSGQRHRPAR